jgi:hypothetical protein
MNKAYLKHLIAEHRAWLVPPVERPIKLRPDQTYPLGSPAEPPRVTCIGRFQSSSTRKNDPARYSELTIVWLQDEFALPIDPSVLEKIGLNWHSLASNFDQ